MKTTMDELRKKCIIISDDPYFPMDSEESAFTDFPSAPSQQRSPVEESVIEIPSWMREKIRSKK